MRPRINCLAAGNRDLLSRGKPAETNIPALRTQLAVVWSLIEGAPLSLQRGTRRRSAGKAHEAGDMRIRPGSRQ
jgi:hypothetical protein